MNARWKAYEWQRVKALLDRGHTIASVALMTGKSDLQIRDKLRWESMSEADREVRAAQIKARRKAEYVPSVPRGDYSTTASRPAPELIADRDRRLAISRTITAAICGDPPFGYSALDRKRQGVSA
jgi:hypothetical protein